MYMCVSVCVCVYIPAKKVFIGFSLGFERYLSFERIQVKNRLKLPSGRNVTKLFFHLTLTLVGSKLALLPSGKFFQPSLNTCMHVLNTSKLSYV